LPAPWFGDLAAADIFILMLNPGLHPCDYYAEYHVPEYRAALVSNLRQRPDQEFPLFHLDPQFSWTTGASYWRARLVWLARALVEKRGLTYRKALSEIARRICILQLVPYHSAAFGLSRSNIDRLHSPALMKNCVQELVLSRPDTLTLVTRQVECWGLPDRPNVLSFLGGERRAAHLSSKSRGGQALARHLGVWTG
jgi:hypothetical protein